MLDMDDASEVNAAAATFTGALDKVDGQVAGTVRELVLPRSPASPLDKALDAQRRWVKATFGRALAAGAGRAEATYHRTVYATNALDAQDIAGGAQVNRESV